MISNKRTVVVGGSAAVPAALGASQRLALRGGQIAAGLFGVLLALVFSPGVRAQTFTSGGTGVLGDFINPLKVTVPGPVDCTYSDLQIDMATGKVWVRPIYTAASGVCPSFFNTLTDTLLTLADLFPSPPSTLPSSFPDGVFEVANFTLQRTNVGTRFDTVTLEFLPNANNTPVWIRATGNVTIGGSTTITLTGSNGTAASGVGSMNPGKGGLGGPGGFRGGDGGNGGLVPTDGARGLGPGGGAGGVVSGGVGSGGTFFTTNKTVAGTVILPGNDLLLMLRGGSGAGGGAGTQNGAAGGGGGGGGGAILIAASGTITVSGTIVSNYAGGSSNGGYGSAGAIRLIAATIAGAGVLSAGGGGGGSAGIIRLEAISITFSGSTSGVQATNVPGQIVLPSDVPAFIRFFRITDNFGNVQTVDPVAQAKTGRTGAITSPDVTMLNPGGVTTTSITVEFVAGPNTTAKPFPAGKTVTLAVGGLDTSQPGGGVNYTAPITCASPPPADCTATVTGVALPRGLSYMSAFTVVNLATDGQLARMFPKTYQGEPIEQVRIQTSGKETEYVLIARSGREFPFKPGSDAGR